ncbi:YheC/YheD family protein [Halobacillus sp. A5]|uniref:YheC/YheD family endospore coat-associated protein n=1 Tax=Halobacillus sp. A5 TaxID=2880263 RepID=UPI0020A67AE2|nr:YheC/YheD family protein [Halobacillus sp. A5]MCP3028970.1 YheC/YheD family protein [Halobacillus sp. A5]
MTSIGMLSHRDDPRTAFKSYAYAASAKMEGADFFFFSPGRVNFKEETILGWVYERGEWKEVMVPFPDVIYNSSSPVTPKQEVIVEELRQRIPFTSNPIGNKMSVYNRIKKDQTFSNYLIPSTRLTTFSEITNLFKEYSDIIIKPCAGFQGNDISYVQKDNKQYTVYRNQLKQVMSKKEFKEFINGLIENGDFLIQPFIKCKLKNGLSYDFRLHTQKDGEGKWKVTTIFPRIASKGVVANLAQGGYSTKFESLLHKEFDEKYYDIKRTLEQFSLQFSHHFDGLYEEPLDELGIDIGIDSNQKIWIFEVNWRPGVPALFSLEMDVAKNLIQYACYLHRQNKKK